MQTKYFLKCIIYKDPYEMKIIQENLSDFIRYNKLDENLIDDFLKTKDVNLRKNILKLIISASVALPYTIIQHKLEDKDNLNIENKLNDIASSNINSEELKRQLYILNNYIPTAIEDEKEMLQNIQTKFKSGKVISNTKRNKPNITPTLEEITNYNYNDADLLPNKVEKKLKTLGVPSYLTYVNYVKNRGHNAPNNGFINLNNLKTSNRGVFDIINSESFRNYGYKAESKGNIVTIGFGTAFNPTDYKRLNLPMPYKYGDVVSDRKLYVYFYGRLHEFETVVGESIKEGIKRNPMMVYMPQEAFDAVVSYAYSIGRNAFKKSKLSEALRNGDLSLASSYIRDGFKSEKGHENRRKKEYDMFTNNFNGTDWGKPENKQILKAIDKLNKKG